MTLLIIGIAALWLFALYLSISKYRMRIKHLDEMRELRRAEFDAIQKIVAAAKSRNPGLYE